MAIKYKVKQHAMEIMPKGSCDCKSQTKHDSTTYSATTNTNPKKLKIFGEFSIPF